MFSALNFKSDYFNYTHHRMVLLTACLLVLTAPAIAQNMSNSRICRAYELELRKIDYNTGLSTRQAMRYQQLAQMQEQAKADAKRFSCNRGLFSSGSNSEECRYINISQQRLEIAASQIFKQAASQQQRRMKQAVYMDMSYYNCRSPQNREWLMQENRHTSQPATRNRIKKTYKKQKLVRQASLKPSTILEDLSSAEKPTDLVPVKASYSGVKPNFSILTEPSMNNAKAAENPPPPAVKAVDYVPNSNVRRVGPEYLPGQ